MAFRKMSDFEGVTNKEKLAIYDEITKNLEINPNLRKIFELCLETVWLFPNINLGKNINIENYILKWIASYSRADSLPPSKTKANPKTPVMIPLSKK